MHLVSVGAEIDPLPRRDCPGTRIRWSGHEARQEPRAWRELHALHYLEADGLLKVVGLHRFEGGNWAEVLEGEGYRFHRPCQPPEVAPEDADLDSVEAKPKGATKPSLAVSRKIVAAYLEGNGGTLGGVLLLSGGGQQQERLVEGGGGDRPGPGGEVYADRERAEAIPRLAKTN